MRIFFQISLIAFLAASARAQSASVPPAFEAADVHVSPHSHNPGVRGGYYTGGRYELHQATMADLIRIAWGLDGNNRVIGGPSWLDDDLFDVLAKAPDATPRETANLMLRNLLEDRFHLGVHEDKRPLQAYVLTQGKRAPQLREASQDAALANSGQCQSQPRPADAGAIDIRIISCRNVTMDAFTKELPALASDYFGHIPMVNLSELKGSWDFSLKWTTRAQLQPGGDSVSLFEAIDKQLGLKLELRETPLPVIVVDHANEKPTESTPEMLRKLPPTPTEFEVAAIKPTPPGAAPREKILPGGEIDISNSTLKDLLLYAWDIAGREGSNDELLVGPKWMETERFDVIAKASSEKSSDAPPLDQGALQVMMRNLLIARFGMVFHYENRPVTVYNLTGSKPKLTRADPSSRTGCKVTPQGNKSAPPQTRNFLCRNVTMAGFAERLRDLATDYIDHPVVNATGLEGGWDFVLSFSSRGPVRNDAQQGIAEAADPDGKLTLFEALDKELGLKLETRKAPMPVLVIDRMEQKPTDN